MNKNIAVSAYTKGGVVHIRYNAGFTLDLAKIKLLLAVLEKERNGKTLPVVIDFSGVLYIDREARLTFFSEITRQAALLAFVVSNSRFNVLLNSASETLASQFYIKIFNAPVMAEKWINTALKEVVVLS